VAKIMNLIGESTLKSLSSFRDAGIGPADYPIAVTDVLRGLSIGMNFNWVSSERFLELGNLECSWIVPRRIMACASPSQAYSS
jgi:hypothetical protein